MRGRRRFDHLVIEISLATESRLPRYPLWLLMHELGWNPEDLSRTDAIAFCEGHLNGFLAARGLRIGRSASRRMLRAIQRFNPLVPTPEERFASF